MKKGFTLIELLVVVAILGLLLSVVISAYHSAKEKQKINYPIEGTVIRGH